MEMSIHVHLQTIAEATRRIELLLYSLYRLRGELQIPTYEIYTLVFARFQPYHLDLPIKGSYFLFSGWQLEEKKYVEIGLHIRPHAGYWEIFSYVDLGEFPEDEETSDVFQSDRTKQTLDVNISEEMQLAITRLYDCESLFYEVLGSSAPIEKLKAMPEYKEGLEVLFDGKS